VTSIGELAETDYCYLTTAGRRSGRPHRIEIWFVAYDDGAYLLSDTGRSDWYRNIEGNPAVTLEIAGERRDTTARTVGGDDPANTTVRPAMVAKYAPTDAGDDLQDWSRTAFLVRIDWPPV
jgi:deazaflavin-dependent oxidoreductase (nitroreductase family)